MVKILYFHMNKIHKRQVFKEDTFLHNITYKVQQGKVSFAKVFWFGLLGKLITGWIYQAFPNVITVVVDVGYLVGWIQGMWYSRRNLQNKIWFVIGFGLPIFTIALYLLYV